MTLIAEKGPAIPSQTQATHRDPASFRDPQGFIFRSGGILYRSITPDAALLLNQNQDFTSSAIAAGLLLPFELDASGLTGTEPVLRPELIDLITYPHEWCFDQLKQAALLTLDVNMLALKSNLTLKDASAFNVQLHHGASVFIDHTSFEPTDGALPWRPYSQFCRHFLNPLVMSSYRDIHAGAYFRLNLDGIPQQTANDFLPWRSKFVPSILIHMVLQNRFIRRAANFEREYRNASRSSRGRQLDLLKHLRGFVAGLQPAAPLSTWADYYANTNYDVDTFAKKKELVTAAFEGRRIGTLWDIGANEGTFSRLVHHTADRVLALDLDHNAVNANFLANSRFAISNISALVYDVVNPTPALGFENAERPALEERCTADVILALAVIHHLSISDNVPFELSAKYFATRGKELVLEFVGRADSQVQRLLKQKNVSYDWYTEENFKGAFSKYFRVMSQHEIPNTDRCIYRLSRHE